MNNLQKRMLKFVVENDITYDEACYLFDISFDEYDYLIIYGDRKSSPNTIEKVKKVLDHFDLKDNNKEIDRRFFIAKINSEEIFKKILEK